MFAGLILSCLIVSTAIVFCVDKAVKYGAKKPRIRPADNGMYIPPSIHIQRKIDGIQSQINQLQVLSDMWQDKADQSYTDNDYLYNMNKASTYAKQAITLQHEMELLQGSE